MKVVRESIGLVVAAMSIVALLGLAGWCVYSEGKAIEETAPFTRVLK